MHTSKLPGTGGTPPYSHRSLAPPIPLVPVMLQSVRTPELLALVSNMSKAPRRYNRVRCLQLLHAQRSTHEWGIGAGNFCTAAAHASLFQQFRTLALTMHSNAGPPMTYTYEPRGKLMNIHTARTSPPVVKVQSDAGERRSPTHIQNMAQSVPQPRIFCGRKGNAMETEVEWLYYAVMMPATNIFCLHFETPVTATEPKHCPHPNWNTVGPVRYQKTIGRGARDSYNYTIRRQTRVYTLQFLISKFPL